MGLVDALLGPRSKYDDRLPYTYEARMPIFEGEDEYNSYMSDTICGLIKYLAESGVDPQEVAIYEIFIDGEKLIPKELYISKKGGWMRRKAICKSFKDHYDRHIYEGGCAFHDRNCKGSGP